MVEAGYTSQLSATFVAFALLSLPPLLGALVVGLIISIIQAATQIQDQTLPQTFKLIAVFAILVGFSPVLAGPLVVQAERIFTDFAFIVR